MINKGLLPAVLSLAQSACPRAACGGSIVRANSISPVPAGRPPPPPGHHCRRQPVFRITGNCVVNGRLRRVRRRAGCSVRAHGSARVAQQRLAANESGCWRPGLVVAA